VETIGHLRGFSAALSAAANQDILDSGACSCNTRGIAEEDGIGQTCLMGQP
jgi:hypothetical protein